MGVGVIGDCNRFATRLGGARAGGWLRTVTLGAGDGILSRIGWRATVISRRLRLCRASRERLRETRFRRISSLVVFVIERPVLRFLSPN